MKTLEFIPIDDLCTHYEIETSFFTQLSNLGIIEIKTVQSVHCVHHEKIPEVEKIIRLHQDLDLNFEGIDTVLNLLEKIEKLQEELVKTKNRLRIYEE